MRHTRTQLIADALHIMDTNAGGASGRSGNSGSSGGGGSGGGGGFPRSDDGERGDNTTTTTPPDDTTPFAPTTPSTSSTTTRASSTTAAAAATTTTAAAAYDVQHARRILSDIAANMHSGWWGLRLFAYALSWLYRYVCMYVWVICVSYHHCCYKLC